MPGSSSTLKLQTNVPETIALKFPDGVPVSSQYSGDQIMFSLTDDRKLYLAPVVAKKIEAAGVGQGELFSICKREVTHGNRRVIDYQVEKVSGTAVPGESPAVSSSAGVASSNSGRPQNNNGIHAVKAPTPAAPDTMAACYRSAVDVALAAMTYAKERGLHMSPTFEDIRTIAATFFIAETRGAGVRA